MKKLLLFTASFLVFQSGYAANRNCRIPIYDEEVDCGINHRRAEEIIESKVYHQPKYGDLNLAYKFVDVEDLKKQFGVNLLDPVMEEFLSEYPIVRLRIENYEPNEYFSIYQRDMSGKLMVVPGFETPIYGAMIEDKIIPLRGFSRGEPIDFIAVSNKRNKSYAMVRVIPDPIKVVGADGRQFSVEALDKSRRHFMLSLKGFDPYEQCHIVMKTENEEMSFDVIASPEGKKYVNLFPQFSRSGGDTICLSVKSFRSDEILATDLETGNVITLRSFGGFNQETVVLETCEDESCLDDFIQDDPIDWKIYRS